MLTRHWTLKAEYQCLILGKDDIVGTNVEAGAERNVRPTKSILKTSTASASGSTTNFEGKSDWPPDSCRSSRLSGGSFFQQDANGSIERHRNVELLERAWF